MERSPAESLAEVAAIGGYFAMSTGPVPPGAVSLATLASSDAALEPCVADVGRRLATDDRRVAASIFFQGLAARLWSPVVAAELLFGTGLRFEPASTWWHPTDGCFAEDPEPGSVDDVWPELLSPLADQIRSVVGLSEHILRGNAASALVGSLAVLARARPELTKASGELARRHLSDGRPLAGTGAFTERGFVRRSCCLYYRVPGGGLCGDCVLATA